jgi:hypothetical protein
MPARIWKAEQAERQIRDMPEQSEFLTKRFRLTPIGPDQVSDDWLRWTGDAELMGQMNAPARKMRRVDLQQYVAAGKKSGRAIIGIYDRQNNAHAGIYEIQLSPQHKNATFNVLIDQKRYVLSVILRETDPVLLRFLKERYGIQKAVAKVVDTYLPALRYYEEVQWMKEGVLRGEHRSVDGTRRVDVIQFGKLL